MLYYSTGEVESKEAFKSVSQPPSKASLSRLFIVSRLSANNSLKFIHICIVFSIFLSIHILCQNFFLFFPSFRPFDEAHKQAVKPAIIVCL